MAYTKRQKLLYNAMWRSKNRARVRQTRRDWYAANRKKVRAYMKAWRLANAEHHREHTRRWRRKKHKLGVEKLGTKGKMGPPTKKHPPFVFVRGPRT